MLVLTRMRNEKIVLDHTAYRRAFELLASIRRCEDVISDRWPEIDSLLKAHPPANTTITLVAIRGDKVRLGTDAPAYIDVHRQEVYDAIHATEAPAA